MSISKPDKQRLLLCLSLLVLGSSACVTIPDGVACSVSGDISGGGICSHTEGAATQILSFQEMVDFLDPQPARICVPVPGMQVCADDETSGAAVSLPARGGAISMSSTDWGAMKTALETACRELGSACTYQIKQSIASLARISK